MSKDRKQYMRDIYSQKWHDKRKSYGVSNYDKFIFIELTNIKQSGKVLEVAIGDGEPYSKYMLSMHYDVYGIDIAPYLINQVQESFPDINASVGDAENIKFSSDYFDITYCFRSSWYFPNIEKAIGEMIRVTKHGGMVIFDLQNKNHISHIKNMKKKTFYHNHQILSALVRYLKNIIKIICRPIKHYYTDWSLRTIIYETPSDISAILSLLSNKVSSLKIFGFDSLIHNSCKEIEASNIDYYDRIIIKLIK